MRKGTGPVIACAALWAAWALGAGAGAPVRASSPDLGAPEARRAMAAADEAARAGDLQKADRLYRVAWISVETRPEAAKRLRDLHSAGRRGLPIDEETLDTTWRSLGPAFQRYDTGRFVILSDADRQTTLQRVGLMERTAHQFFRVMDRLGYPAHPPAQRLLCVFFADHDDYREFARTTDRINAPWIAGYYSGADNRVVFYDDETSPRFREARRALDEFDQTLNEARARAVEARRARDGAAAEHYAAAAERMDGQLRSERQRLAREADDASASKTIHETAHLLAFNCGLQSRARLYPFWFTEGLATCFETDDPSASFGPDRPTEARLEAWRRAAEQERAMPLRELVALSQVPGEHAHTAEGMYTLSHALWAYLFRYERDALRGYALDLWAEPAGRIPAERHLELFEARFGAPEALQRKMRIRLLDR